MKKKSIETLKELIRRERINAHHESITDTDINSMIDDVLEVQKYKFWLQLLVVFNCILLTLLLVTN
jgi:hypothetical protein